MIRGLRTLVGHLRMGSVHPEVTEIEQSGDLGLDENVGEPVLSDPKEYWELGELEALGRLE